MNVVITRFPYESQLGGEETVVLNLAKGLRAKGHRVSFIGTCPVLLKLFEENDFSATKLIIPRAPVTKQQFLFFVLLYPFIRWQLHRILKPLKKKDVIYMLSLTEKLVLTKEAKERGMNVIWGEHESLQRHDGTFRPWLASHPFLPRYRKYSRSATVVVVSRDLQRQFKELGGVENVILIPNGIDLLHFSPLCKTSYASFPGKFIVGTVGRLKREKGMELFLTLASQLIHNIPDSHFVIAGDGVMKKTLQQQAKKLTIDNRVEFFGEIPHDHVREVYTMCDVLVFLSQEMETFGLTPLESMAMGKATILTQAFGFLDPAAYASMLIIHPQDIEGAAKIVERLYRDPAYKIGMEKEGLRFVTRRFSLPRMVDAYERLF